MFYIFTVCGLLAHYAQTTHKNSENKSFIKKYTFFMPFCHLEADSH